MQLPFLEIHNTGLKFSRSNLHGMPHAFGTCTLLSVEGLENLISYLQLSCLQTCTVPFEIKGVLISDTQPDVEQCHVHESYQQKCLSLNNQTNPEEPISLKRKYLSERCEVNEKLIGQRELYEKKKWLNESPEGRENRLTCQREYKRKICANESPELREKRLANQCKYQKKKITTFEGLNITDL